MISTRYLIVMLIGLCAGCFSTPPPGEQLLDLGSTTDSGTVGDSDSDDLGLMTPDAGGTSDSGSSPDAARDTGRPLCGMDEDCPPVDGAAGICADGECSYECLDARVDVDDDLSKGSDGTGCECAAVSATDETCDGVDDDCSGEADDAAPEMSCANQMGVCAGAAMMCAAGEYATCDDAFFEAMVADWRPTEQYVCDGLDNDCDGTEDEDCCAPGTTPGPNSLGNGIWAATAPATTGAPAGAAFVVAFRVSGSLDVQLQHVDASGNRVGGSITETVPGDLISGIQIASGPNAYYVAVRSNDFATTEQVLVARFSPTLSKLDDWPSLDPAGDRVGNPRIAVGSTHVCVVWDDEVADARILSCYPHGPAPATPSPGDVAGGVGAYDVTETANGFAVVTASPGQLTTFVLAANGTGMTAGPSATVSDLGDPRLASNGSTVVLAWLDGASVRAMEFLQDGTPGQQAVTVSSGADELAVATADQNVVFAFGDTDAGNLWTGSTPVAALGTLANANPIVSSGGVGSFGTLEIEAGPDWHGLAFVRDGPEFHPVSFEGVPGCP